jgi:hypothetical protein
MQLNPNLYPSPERNMRTFSAPSITMYSNALNNNQDINFRERNLADYLVKGFMGFKRWSSLLFSEHFT